MAEEQEDRILRQDSSLPVVVEADMDCSTPELWDWRQVTAGQPNKATYHINHSDVTDVMVDALRPSDCPPDTPFVLKKELPILVIDSLDKYWAGESRSNLPLNGLRVPVEGETAEEAKRALAADLAAQLRLLSMLAVSHKETMAPELKENVVRLLEFMEPREQG